MRRLCASAWLAAILPFSLGCHDDGTAGGGVDPVQGILEERFEIGFDKLPDGTVVDGLASSCETFPGTRISKQYKSLGALFSTEPGSLPVATEGGIGPLQLREGTVNAKTPPNFLVGSPSSFTTIEVRFVTPNDGASPAVVTGRVDVTVVSIGSNPHRIRAFDMVGNEIATVLVPAGEPGPGWYNHTPTSIDVIKAHRLTFEVAGASGEDGHGIDDLSYPKPKLP